MIFETRNGVIIIEDTKCAYFNVFLDIFEWKIARLIWIGFYKNDKNSKCFIGTLPKDIITNYIFKFIGHNDKSIKRIAQENAFIKSTV